MKNKQLSATTAVHSCQLICCGAVAHYSPEVNSTDYKI